MEGRAGNAEGERRRGRRLGEAHGKEEEAQAQAEAEAQPADVEEEEVVVPVTLWPTVRVCGVDALCCGRMATPV